jgi:CubicO group peptidase (beta-lactamase class C family)
MEHLAFRFLACFGVLAATATAAPLPTAAPAAEGFSVERLERMHAFHRAEIAAGRLSGVVTLVARHGRVVDWEAYGFLDATQRTPMRKDAIIRLHSMTKPITSVAVLMLVEEGKLSLGDSVETFIPALANRKVCIGGTFDKPLLADAVRPITVRHLLTHTAGFTYPSTDADASIVSRLQAQPGADPAKSRDFAEFVERLSRLPLVHQPGDGWTYGVSTDVLGYLVEVVSGQPFAEFVQKRILEPLEMTDTSFSVPEAKRQRVATVYTYDAKSRRLVDAQDAFGLPARGEALCAFPSGGGGLYSTAGDYARFAQMLLNKGRLGDVRLLGRKTVEYMLTNQLAHKPDPTHGFSDSAGFGLGGFIEIIPSLQSHIGSKGVFGWDGWASTFFMIDPAEDLTLIYISQQVPYNQLGLYPKIFNLFYQALVD